MKFLQTMKSSTKSNEFVYESDEEVEYEPPAGFSAEKLDKIKLDDASEIFLVQLPPTVDLTKISKLPLQDGQFDIDGVSYSLSRESLGSKSTTSNNLQLLTRKKDSVRPSSHKISARLKISRAIDIPSIDYNKVRVSKPVVQQKTNLKMRVFPSGYSKADYTSTDKPAEPKKKKSKSKP